mgnify:CR=1 FL=1
MALQKEFKTQGDFLFRNRSYFPILFLGIGLIVFLYGEYIEPFHDQKIESYKFSFEARDGRLSLGRSQ